jgi:hypothetical protein
MSVIPLNDWLEVHPYVKWGYLIGMVLILGIVSWWIWKLE